MQSARNKTVVAWAQGRRLGCRDTIDTSPKRTLPKMAFVGGNTMNDMSLDFEDLVERAEQCGVGWASRLRKEIRARQTEPPRRWPGALDEARQIVDRFAR